MITTNRTSEFRLLLPETIWLEPAQYEQAKRISEAEIDESHRWQSYLEALALLGFEAWLKQRLKNTIVDRTFDAQTQLCYLQAKNFKIEVIASEHILDEMIYIPKNRIEQPDTIAPFYVAIEILEEQAEAIVRGFLSHDRLMQYCANQPEADCYPIPIVQFDPEPDHLVAYCRHLQPLSSIATSDLMADRLNPTRTKLSQWLQDIFDQSWNAIETLINPETQLLLSTRSLQAGSQRGKLINLGLQLDDQTVAMLITITPEAEEKLKILVQLHPIEDTQFLPPDLQITLISNTRQTLQTVSARSQDNYIQLKPFKGKSGQRFCIEIALHDRRIQEAFEI
ncbi:MAG TPA: DUF1822 family protein [Leptolyngbya sp.]|jgi:hypothetical protein|nr:DUF1822 family protein [Leptolyngbya sp.]